MALILADRVRELTATTGTGSVTLIGSPDGFETFAASIGDGNTTYYTIAEKTGDNWEVGVGTYRSTGNLLERTTVLSSSNGGNKVAFTAGDKDVFVTLPAEKVVSTDAAGTMAYQNANSVAITGGAINGTTIGSTTPAAATFTTLTATGQTSLGGAAGSEGLRVIKTASSSAWLQATGSVVSAFAGTVEFAGVSTAPSGDAVAINYCSQNLGTHSFKTGASKLTQFSVSGVVSAVNYWNAVGSATTKSPIFSVAGSDTNIPLAFQSKGTGAIDLAAGSSGVNISNGGTVTAITRTAEGSSYTSIPTIAISAPTTAGGVQATASANLSIGFGWTITNAGTGYAVNDVITVVGGTGTAATYGVTSIGAGGSVTGISRFQIGSYSVLPPSPSSTTTNGAGTGFTIANSYGFLNATITNAGSGYVEQPTVTFSGGGGSGAAAYATVGSGTQIKSIGSTMSFYTPGGEQLRVADQSNTSRYIQVKGASSSGNPEIGTAAGTLVLFGGTSSGIAFYSNNYSNAQFNIAHTASAVNYVQVTGAPTGNVTQISAQGSDNTTYTAIGVKGGSGYISFFNGGSHSSANTLFRVLGTAVVQANYPTVTPAAASGAPVFGVAGSDTNIDLALTPKGTGLVRFGTYTAGAPTATGYISIKAADGTTYKVLVGT